MRLAYLAQDRGDLAETAKLRAQSMERPTPWDFQELKRLGRYLAGKPRFTTRFRAQPLPKWVTSYVDSNFAGCPITRKSTSGMAIFLGRHLLRGSSNLQSLIALSVGEAEYYAASSGAQYGMSMRSLLEESAIFKA